MLCEDNMEAEKIDHKSVRGYKEEPGVEADSKNDTFVAARLWIDNQFWKGVPFIFERVSE